MYMYLCLSIFIYLFIKVLVLTQLWLKPMTSHFWIFGGMDRLYNGVWLTQNYRLTPEVLEYNSIVTWPTAMIF